MLPSTELSAQFKLQLAEQISQFIAQDRQFVIALSGGLDSCVLLAIFTDYFKTNNLSLELLQAIYINHGLSQHTDSWQQHCQAICQQSKIKFTAVNVSLARQNRQSLEALAREQRYLALQNAAPARAVILTGQHLDDQTETVLLRLKRGSGPTGLAAMATISPLHTVNKASQKSQLLWRPLLSLTKQALTKYAKVHQLTWVEDESNQLNDFDRNFLRNQIIPQLAQRWPGFSQNVARTARLCQQQNELLSEVAEQDLAECNSPLGLNMLALKLLSVARFNNLIRYWLNQNNEPMPSEKVMQQIANILTAKQDAQPLIQLSHGQIRCYQTQLVYLSQAALDWFECPKQPINWQPLETVKLTENGCILFKQIKVHQLADKNLAFRLPKSNEVAQIRFSIAGQTICQPSTRSHRRSIKKLLQEYQIPAWQRNSIAYLFYNEELVSALGYWVCQAFVAQEDEIGCLAEITQQ